jgi:MHS family dicarboxylic acid transporter PcaT-like MFS transporter
VVGYTAGGSLIFYTFTTYMQKYLVNSAGMSIKTASNVMTVCLFLYMCMQPLFGALSDRIGRRNNMLLFGALGTIATVPILTALGHVDSPVAAGALILLALAIVSFYTSVSGIVKAELFPPRCARWASAWPTRSPTRCSAAPPNTWRWASRAWATSRCSTGTCPR